MHMVYVYLYNLILNNFKNNCSPSKTNDGTY